MRTYGDRFLVQVQRELKATAEREAQARRESHRQKFESAWLAYLSDIEQELKAAQPADYLRFQADRKAKREAIQQGRWQLNAKERLTRFDSEPERLKALQQFFGHLLDFWTWDERYNPEKLRP